MKRLFACAVIALLTFSCTSENRTPTDPSQVNIEFTTTDVVVGNGATANPGSRVTVNYTLWLYDSNGTESKGRRMGSSTDPGGMPLEFVLGSGGFIPGFQQGVVGMRAGGKRRVYVPSSLGYGGSGSSDGQIPPNAALVFEIDLLNVQ